MLEVVVKVHKAPTVADGQRCKVSGGLMPGRDSALTHQWMPILFEEVLS